MVKNKNKTSTKDIISTPSPVPYVIIEESDTHQIRLFENYEPTSLYWHRDKENRKITLLEGKLEVQLDNELPVFLFPGESILVPAMTYHRGISNTRFVVKIEFFSYLD